MTQNQSGTPSNQVPNPQLTGNALNKKVDALLAKMTLEEKVGQLVQFSSGTPTGPGTGRQSYDAMIAAGEVGSFLNVADPKKANAFQHIAMEKSRLHIPLIYGFDVIHGYRTIFPVPLGMASSFDPPLVQQTSRVAAEEASADGIRWVFSPMVDIARDARWGRIVEGAGESPYLGSAMARAYVQGYQGTSLSNPDSVAACVKHYAAYGAVIAGREYNAVDMSDVMLRQVYLPPYQAAIDAGAATVMSSFNSLNSVPCNRRSLYAHRYPAEGVELRRTRRQRLGRGWRVGRTRRRTRQCDRCAEGNPRGSRYGHGERRISFATGVPGPRQRSAGSSS